MTFDGPSAFAIRGDDKDDESDDDDGTDDVDVADPTLRFPEKLLFFFGVGSGELEEMETDRRFRYDMDRTDSGRMTTIPPALAFTPSPLAVPPPAGERTRRQHSSSGSGFGSGDSRRMSSQVILPCTNVT